MTNDAGALKACPFCGERPRFYPAQVMVDGDCPESVTCSNDDCPTQPSTDYLPISQAIAAWNRRAALPQPEARTTRIFSEGSCATDGCEFPAAWLFTAGNVTSKYCASCYAKITTPPAAPTDTALVDYVTSFEMLFGPESDPVPHSYLSSHHPWQSKPIYEAVVHLRWQGEVPPAIAALRAIGGQT